MPCLRCYQRDVTGRGLDELLEGAKPFTRELAEATDAKLAELDAAIAALSRGWELDRIAPLERSIMRVALQEIARGLPPRSRSTRRSSLARSTAGPMLPASSTASSARPRASSATASRRRPIRERSVDEVRAIAEQLRAIAEQLRDPEVGDERAATLAREAAELVSRRPATRSIVPGAKASPTPVEPAMTWPSAAPIPTTCRRLVEDYLATLAFSEREATAGLAEAMRYSLLAGGKRIRPVLCLAAARAAGDRAGRVLPAAAAIELIHTYSLIHDDLPAMDDDEFRRGRPTSHVVHGEGVAILAGDGLFAEAIRIFCPRGEPGRGPRSARRARAGDRGGGHGRGPVPRRHAGEELDAEGLRELHALKTGRLIAASVLVPLLLAGVEPRAMAPYRRFADELGVLFQIVDDILDVTGSDEELGKPQGSDERLGKVTYVSLFGLQSARDLAAQSHAKASAALAEATGDTTDLERIADYIHTRRR